MLSSVSLKDLKSRCKEVQALCWAPSTWSTRNSQWRRYMSFCEEYQIHSIPASVETMCLYVTYLTQTLAYSSICNYMSAVWSLHEFMGHQPSAKGTFLLSCTMRGAKRLLGDTTLSSDPLLPEHLKRIYAHLHFNDKKDLVFRCALCLSFRCLLRKCHFTSSPHMILCSQVEFTEYGLLLSINSSKTIQFNERTLQIPVVESPGSILCPVKWLKIYLSLCKVPKKGPLLLDCKSKGPLSYEKFTKRLKELVKKAGIGGRITCHSLRRGSATYLSRLGLPLHDVKMYGDWKSLTVLLYLADDTETRLMKDYSVAHSLRCY